MTLSLLGLNHRTAPLELRERLAIPPHGLSAAFHELHANLGIQEVVILSTCNRVEVYAVASEPSSATARALTEFFSARSELSIDTFGPTLYALTEDEAAAHLFRVAAGLESMILGESEIGAQVKQAYAAAREHGATGPVLNRLFQKALHSTKLTRTQTAIAQGQASIGSVVSALVEQVFGPGKLGTRDVLLWGAGKAAEATAKHLLKRGIRQLWIVNRTQAKAQDLASLCRGGWVSWEQALGHLAHVDVAIICTQAPHYVIDEADLAAILPQRQGRPLVLIDLAVPRNIQPSLKQVPGLHLYNVDDLQSVAEAGLSHRRQALAHCDRLIAEQVGHFLRWHQTFFEKKKEGACRSVAAFI